MSELTPCICVADSRAAIEWYREALGAEVSVEPIVMPAGGPATASSLWTEHAG